MPSTGSGWSEMPVTVSGRAENRPAVKTGGNNGAACLFLSRPELLAHTQPSAIPHATSRKSQRPGKFIPGLGLTPPPPNPVKGQAR